jgi:hypothetical protein
MNGSTVIAQPGSAFGSVTLQQAYDNAFASDPHILAQTADPIRFRSDATGPVLQVQDTVGANILEVDDTFVEVDGNLRIVDAFVNHGAANSLTLTDNYDAGVPFIGGGILSNGTVGYSNTTWIWALLQESKIYQARVGPGFAAFTLFNALARIENDGNFDLVQALVLNNGVRHARTSAGTSTTVQNIGLSNSPSLQTTVLGAVMTKSTGDTAVTHRPGFSTVGFSTVNFGTSRGLHYFEPAVVLFGSAAGTENVTAEIAVDVEALPSFGNIVKNALRSQLAAASNTRVINALGTAQSDFGGTINMTADLVGIQYGASQDWFEAWAGAGYKIEQNASPLEQFRKSFPAAGRMLFDWSNDMEWTVNCVDGFSIGAQSGANGNQYGNVVTNGLTPAAAGDATGILLTHANNFVNNTVGTRGRVSAWVINGFSYSNSTGTVTDSDTLTVSGMVTSSPGVTITNRQSINVIAGRSRFQSAMQYNPINPAALSAGDNNDWAGLLTGSANNGMRHWARVTPDGGGTSVITGIDSSSAQDGDCFKITNIGTVNLTIGHQDVASSASNRIISPTVADFVLAATQSCEVIWDAVTDRWRLLYGSGT